jgi:hypothetical protein
MRRLFEDLRDLYEHFASSVIPILFFLAIAVVPWFVPRWATAGFLTGFCLWFVPTVGMPYDVIHNISEWRRIRALKREQVFRDVHDS